MSPFAVLVAAAVLAAAVPASAASSASVGPIAFSNTVTPPPAPAPEDGPSPIPVGRRAPDFQYQAADAMWQYLHNVLEVGDVLLVFGASDVELRTLERERSTFLRAGIVPLAVVERSDREVWTTVRRLGLTYSLLADPKGVIGRQYGVLDTVRRVSTSTWFVIDTKGRVREVGGKVPAEGWPTLVAASLGRSIEGPAQASTRR